MYVVGTGSNPIIGNIMPYNNLTSLHRYGYCIDVVYEYSA